MFKFFIFLSILALSIFPVLLPIEALAASPTFDDAQASTLLSKINSYRVSQGKTALKYNSKLASIAKSRVSAMFTSQAIINSGDPSHNIPGFGSFDSQASRLGLDLTIKGQYIGENFTASSSGVDGAYSNWLKSPSHLANIVDANYEYTGLALASNLQELGDPQIPAGLTSGVVVIQTFATAGILETPKTDAPETSNSTPKTETNTPTPKQVEPQQKKETPTSQQSTVKTAQKTTQSQKIDKTKKISSKLKFGEVLFDLKKLFTS